MIEIDPFDPETRKLGEIVAELQGKVSGPSIERAVKSGELAVIRIGGQRFTSRAAVREWIKTCTAKDRRRKPRSPDQSSQ